MRKITAFKTSLISSAILLAAASHANAQSQAGGTGSAAMASPTVQGQPTHQPTLGITSDRQGLSIAPEGVAKMKLSPGTVIEIHIHEEGDLDGTYRIDDEGNIVLPLAGTIHVAGLTLRLAEKAVSEKLVAEEILKSPHVTVNLDEYSSNDIIVTGQVNAPGRFPALAPRKLVDLLAMASGETSLAGNLITIHRFGQPADSSETVHYGPETNNPTVLNMQINPGDSVLVQKAGVVYVLGSVNRPGGYVMQEEGNLNIAQAMALAFGTSPEASTGKIRILRKAADGQVQQIPADYDSFKKGKALPIQLQAEDIVYVPSSAVKSTFINAKTELSAAAASAIYVAR
jgi:polysaccharide export outer membrane protein